MVVLDGSEVGAIEDYAHSFKNSPALAETEARTRGLLSRIKGTDGWQLGKNASDGVYALCQAKKIATKKSRSQHTGWPVRPAINLLFKYTEPQPSTPIAL